MPKPLLYGSQVDTRPQTTCRERRTELMQPEVILVEFGPFRTGLKAVEKIQLRVTSCSWKHQSAGLVRLPLPLLQVLHQLCWDRNLAFLVSLWRPSTIRLVADMNRRS